MKIPCFFRCVLSSMCVLSLCLAAQSQDITPVNGDDEHGSRVEILSPRPSEMSDVMLLPIQSVKPLVLPSIESLCVDLFAYVDVQPRAAATLAELSELAYADEHNRTRLLRMMGFDRVVTLDEGPMSGFVAIEARVIVVAFRGTNPLSPGDWLANIDLFWQKSMSGERKFHKGFQNAYARLAEKIDFAIQSESPKYIWITGHSLGGAMATCCAYDWVMKRLPLTGLVTFGQPRVANPAMAQFLDQQIGSRYVRFRHGEDLVPQVPPAKTMLSPAYQHAGRLVWYTNGVLESEATTPDYDRSGVLRTAALLDDYNSNELHMGELQLLRDYLRATQSQETKDAIPAFLQSEESLAESRLADSMAPRYEVLEQTSTQIQTRSLSKLNDHALLEYIRMANNLLLE